MAMLGFAVDGTRIRYDVPVTVASAVFAIGAVGVGLAIVGTNRVSLPRVAVGGLFTGAGVAAMHYTGMAAAYLDGRVSAPTESPAALSPAPPADPVRSRTRSTQGPRSRPAGTARRADRARMLARGPRPRPGRGRSAG